MAVFSGFPCSCLARQQFLEVWPATSTSAWGRFAPWIPIGVSRRDSRSICKGVASKMGQTPLGWDNKLCHYGPPVTTNALQANRPSKMEENKHAKEDKNSHRAGWHFQKGPTCDAWLTPWGHCTADQGRNHSGVAGEKALNGAIHSAKCPDAEMVGQFRPVL